MLAARDALRAATQRDLRSDAPDPARLRQLKAHLPAVEPNWLDPAGIPGRPWFQHLLYAARYTYAHLELPGLTEAVEGADWSLASYEAGRIEAALSKNTQLLRTALRDWERDR